MNIQKHSTEMYSASLYNRLDELNNPTEEDKIRWIMELIQNAKDSLFSKTNADNRDIIEISIEIKRDHDNNNQCNEVIFTHNGPPFTEKQRDGLAYKNSSGKNNDKSTGKFGTGFVTVHVLSKTVYISGDIYKNGEIKSFSFTMCREGNNKEELEKNLYVTENSYHEDNEPIKLTQFKFPIQSDLSRKCVELGLIHFKKNIPNVLINCNNIGCINLIDDKNVSKYSASLKKQINESIYCYEVLCNKYTKNFLVVKDDEQNLDISIEIDANKYENDKEILIIPHDDKESLFITFPLIGSKAHILPFYINSPDFHPTTERNGLYLDGPDYKNDEKTRVCKNKEILMKSVVLYEKLIRYVKDNGCSNIFELSVGLTPLKMPYKTFDSKWYNDMFLKEMRKVFSDIITVKTVSGENILLKNACFPTNHIDDNLVGRFIRLSITNKYYPNIVSENDCLMWRNRLCESNQIVSINDIIDKIHIDTSILLEDQLSSLNEIILFISDFCPNILYTVPLVPDMNNVFKCIKKDGITMKKCQTVPDELIELMESLSIQWKSVHINKMITSLDISEDKLNDAENILIEKISSDEQTCFNIMQYVVKDNETRKNMFDLINQFQINNIKWDNPIFVQNINPKIWEPADSIVIDKIMQIISEYDQNTMKEKIDIIAKFISVFKNHYKSNENIINSIKIIPNGNYVMKSLNDLYNKSDVFHDHFNPILKQYYNIDFDDFIIHPKINQIIKSNKTEEITDFLSLINQKICEFDIEKQIHIAESIISLVPQNDHQTPLLVDQNKIFEFYKHLNNSDIKQIIIDEKNFNLKNWKFSNKIILSTICKTIEKTEFLDNFKNKLSIDEDNAMNMLNSIHNFEDLYEINKYKIIPNKDGKFMNKLDLISNPDIHNDFYKILSLLEPESKIEQSIVHPKIRVKDIKNFDMVGFHQRLIQLFIDMNESSEQNPNLFHLISNIAKIDITGHSISRDEQLKYDMLKNAHMYFIKKRIRELSSPNKEDFQRWPFELIQNAVDCIQNVDDIHIINPKKNGIIEFDFQEKQVIFTHYGAPFTEKNYISLIYQCGGMKEDDPSAIGRFGTGFLSTLVLSRVVHISGDLLLENGQISGFEITINREGNSSEELNKRIDEMESKKKLNLPIKHETKFIFELPTDQKLLNISINAYNEGFKSLKENIPAVLVFNSSIKTVLITKNDEKYSFSKIKSNPPIEQIIQYYNYSCQSKFFIHYTMKATFEYLNNPTKGISVDCLLEYDEDKNIIPNKRSLYIGFPLFGPKKFDSPFILNSFDFEPEIERSDIILQFDDHIQDSYESQKNKFIISNGIELFEQTIKFAIENKCGNLYNAFSGLKQYFDLSRCSFFSNNNLRIKNILSNYQIFKTALGFQKKSEVIIPHVSDYYQFKNVNILSKNKEMEMKIIYDDFYHLLEELQIEQKQLVIYEHCSKWISALPMDFQSKFQVEELFKFISEKNNLSELNYIGKESKEKFIKKVILFVEKMKKCDDILNNYKLLINIHGCLVKKNSVRKFHLPSIFLDMLDIVKFDYQKYLLHPDIEDLYNNKEVKFSEYKIQNAISDIMNNINTENSITLMKYIINNDEERESMFWFTSFFRNDFTEMIYIQITEIDENCSKKLREMLNKADKNVLKILIEEIQNINLKDNIEFIFTFLQFLKTKIPNDVFENKKLIPNQEYQLMISKDLHKDQIKNENIKNVLLKFLGINIKKDLILDSCSEIINCDAWNLQNISQMVLKTLQKNEDNLKEMDKNDFFSIILEHSLSNTKDLVTIADLIHFFLNQKIELKIHEDETNCWLPNLTEKVMKMAINDIIQHISKFSNISEIKETEEEIKVIYQKLPILYSFTVQYNCYNKIFPNYFGDLKMIDEIQIVYDSQIEIEILDKLIHYLILLHDPNEIEKTLLNKSIILEDELIKKIKNNFYDLNKLSMKIVDGIDHWNKTKSESNENSFKYNEFVSFINENEKLKVAFVDKLPNLFKSNQFEIAQNFDNFIRIIQMQKILNELDDFSNRIEIPHNVLGVPYLIDAFFYNLFIKSNKFMEVTWPNMSIEKTDLSVKYLNETFFINRKEENYNIKAVDFKNNNYYFVIDSPMSQLKNEQKKFVLNLTESNDHYVVIKIDDSMKPPFLWLIKPKIML